MCKKITSKDYNKAKNSVQSSIRQSFAKSDHYKEFLNLHRIEWMAGKRKRVSYKCVHCQELHGSGEINVDHKKPIGKLAYRDFRDAPHFFKVVYCSYDNLQILCKPCHKVKSAWEKKNPHWDNASF